MRMQFKKKLYNNWGRNININPKRFIPQSYNELKKIISKKSFIIHGNQRSYGDVCLNKDLIVSMKNFNQIKKFKKKSGFIEVESGMLLKDLLPFIIEKGWFIPITPGTKYVSLGGMIANNVHGKNVYKNQIKYFVKEIKLLGLNKKILKCTKKKNKKVFDLTIGGFGLTGIILSVTLQLKRINSIYLNQKIKEFNTYKEFFSISKNVGKYEYSVSWVDNFSKYKIQGLNFMAKHSNKKIYNSVYFQDNKIGFLHLIISKLIVKYYFFSRIINFIYRNFKKNFYKKFCSFHEVFYPQDYFIDWNKVYGKKGFFQIQFIIPENKFQKILIEISDFLRKEKTFSTFIVIKRYNEKGKYLNYSGNGYSISFDFKINKNFSNINFFFNSLVKKYSLRVNFSKDLIINRTNAYNYPEFKIFKKEISLLNSKKKINSFFSKRLNI